MSLENSGYDVVEMEFPEYTEEFPPIGRVEEDVSFSANKKEIYRRNREIAAEIQTEILIAQEQAKADKKAELENIYKESAAAAAVPKRRPKAATVMLMLLYVALIMITGLFIKYQAYKAKPAQEVQDPNLKWIEMEMHMFNTETVTVTDVKTEIVEEAAKEIPEEAAEVIAEEADEVVPEEVTEIVSEEVTEIPDPAVKTTAVREPFRNDGTALIYNTEAMSYRFVPEYTITQYGQTYLTVYVTVKNLTDYDYYVVPDFFAKNSNDDVTYASINEYSTRGHYFYPESLIDGEWVESSTHKNSAREFDADHLCSFVLQFDAYKDDISFLYDPQYRINHEYYDKVDVGFEIPFSELEAYLS